MKKKVQELYREKFRKLLMGQQEKANLEEDDHMLMK